MTIYVDIDGTICTVVKGGDYRLAKPLPHNIAVVNDLYYKGHEIVYWTARGTKTGRDWRTVTEDQFSAWGVKYNRIEFGKPVYDLMIDDRACNARILKRLEGSLNNA